MALWSKKKTHQNFSCKVRKSTSICAIDLAVQRMGSKSYSGSRTFDLWLVTNSWNHLALTFGRVALKHLISWLDLSCFAAWILNFLCSMNSQFSLQHKFSIFSAAWMIKLLSSMFAPFLSCLCSLVQLISKKVMLQTHKYSAWQDYSLLHKYSAWHTNSWLHKYSAWYLYLDTNFWHIRVILI